MEHFAGLGDRCERIKELLGLRVEEQCELRTHRCTYETRELVKGQELDCSTERMDVWRMHQSDARAKSW